MSSFYSNAEVTPQEIEAVYNSERKYCGAKLNKAFKTFCRPEIKNLFVKRSFHHSHDNRDYDEEIEQMVEQALNSYYGSYGNMANHDDGNEYGLDNMIPNYIYSPMYHKRSVLPGVVDLCCRDSCPIQTLLAFCPR
jgi:hypothetical protein